jgi:hypothetical protein
MLTGGYGVVIGTYSRFITEQGQWYHVDATIDASGTPYQAAVDVNEVNGQFQYQILEQLDATLFAVVSALPDGWHALEATATSGAIDYARSPIVPQPPSWNDVTGNAAGEALIAMLTGSQRVFAFGSPYTDGTNGVHNVHCNQGDPPGPHQADDGIWQDGCIFALQADGTLSADLGKFSTQTLTTDAAGLPI